MYGSNDLKKYEELQYIMYNFYDYLIENGYNAKRRFSSSMYNYYNASDMSQVWIDIGDTSITLSPYSIDDDNNDILFGIYTKTKTGLGRSERVPKDTLIDNVFIMDLLIEQGIIKPKQVSIFDFIY